MLNAVKHESELKVEGDLTCTDLGVGGLFPHLVVVDWTSSLIGQGRETPSTNVHLTHVKNPPHLKIVKCRSNRVLTW